ncbi:MAG: PD40 domain-containing protein [Myxococcales bacterium]|nr:PD40 domain-containing protein [Myxococcales bacterium]MCB9647756.1 PD40 domain-containing protein [Deltaproteobacteria bacterium]
MTARSNPGRNLVTAAVLAGALCPLPALAQDAVQISPSRRGNCENPLWSRDGKGLAWERVFYEERRIELNVVRDVSVTPVKEERIKPILESRDEAAATLEAFQAGAKKKVAPGEVCREFAWGPKDSPNTFTYSCNVETSSYQLFMTEGEQLTRGNGAAGQPNMTIEGWGLVYVSSNQEREGLFVIHDLIDEIRPVRLLPPGTRVDRMPVWAPNGKKIAFVGHDKDSADIYVIENVRNSEESMVRLTKWASEESNPSWSPDGTKLAFFSDHDGPKKKKKSKKRGTAGQSLYVVDLAKGGEPFLVARDVVPSEQHGPAWTPDSQWLIYAKDHQKGSVIDPIRAARAEPNAKEVMLKTGTVSNKDPQVAARDGRWWMAFSALGKYKGKERTWRKVYVMPIEKLLNTKDKPEEE